MALSGEDNQVIASPLVMPPKLALVREAIARLDTLGQRGGPRSKVMGLDTATMEQLCERLADRQIAWSDAHKWLNKELGGTEEEEIVKQDVIYRFKNHFCPVYDQVRAEHAQRIARLTVAHATDGNVLSAGRVMRHRWVNLLTEKLIATDSLEDMSPAEMSAAMNTLKAIDEGEIKQQELALKVADSDRKAARAQADLRKAELELEKLQQQVNEAKAKYDAAMTAQQSKRSDGRLTAEDIAEAKKAIFGEAA